VCLEVIGKPYNCLDPELKATEVSKSLENEVGQPIGYGV